MCVYALSLFMYVFGSVCVSITVKQCVTETITPDSAALSSSGTLMSGTHQKIKMNKHENGACAFNYVALCVPASVCMFMGVLVAAHGG